MEKVYKTYEIASSEDSYRVRIYMCHKITTTKLRTFRYGVDIIVIVSKEKAVKNTKYKSDWKKFVIKEIAVPCQISSADSVSKMKSC